MPNGLRFFVSNVVNLLLPEEMEKQNLVLVPGLLCDAAMWEHQSRYLSEAADIKIADVAHSETMIGMAEAVLTMAPEKFALAGLSMGGYVSLEIMRVLLASDQDSDLTSREKNRKAAPRKNLKLHCQP
jgi:pimeloyl-ACP methyl ester carboxylesterase